MAKPYGSQNGISKGTAKNSTLAKMPGAGGANLNRCMYRDVSGDNILSLLDTLAAAGGAALFGMTSDGGAYAVTVFLGNDREKRYAASAEAFDDLTAQLTAYFRAE